MKRRAMLFLFALLFAAAPLRAATADEERLAVVTPAAPVMLDDTLLFEVLGIKDYPPEVRARRIQERVEKIAADRRIQPQDIVIVDGDLVTYLAAGAEKIMGLLDLDATASGVPRRVLAETYLEKLRKAVAKYRADRTAEHFGHAINLALLATAVVLATILALRLLRRALLRRFESRYHARIASLKIKSLEVVGAERIWTALIGAFRLLSLAIGLAMVFLYLNFVLASSPRPACSPIGSSSTCSHPSARSPAP